ncbi:nuclear transport factor 2 family protein [Actinomadura parmotrematis]|uniref:Nuclear transport factor 2 family protein n=1 Tax=Actinomadura parmotrematis TaxID=2864039 RepID=A0ABS7FZ86_9ACTN|nr:nuclear transport factor 2 family protein [Actinomadura parmotrematis]MBW8484959.1 nuclear transport factor 2 family protein [Actinomadura parmotrematis]
MTKELDEVHAEFYAAFEAGDLDRMAAVWADGAFAAGVSCVHPGWPMLRGRDEVLRSWALIMANTTYIQFVLTGVETDVYGDHAVVTCEENVLTADDENEDGFLAGGSIVATKVFVRDGGEWRLLLHHGSPVLNSAEEE